MKAMYKKRTGCLCRSVDQDTEEMAETLSAATDGTRNATEGPAVKSESS